MKTTVNFYMFKDAMSNSNFTYEGLRALWEYFEEYENETETELELNPIAFRVEFMEYDNIEEFNDDYGTNYGNYNEIEETLVIPVDDKRFIIQGF